MAAAKDTNTFPVQTAIVTSTLVKTPDGADGSVEMEISVTKKDSTALVTFGLSEESSNTTRNEFIAQLKQLSKAADDMAIAVGLWP